MGANALRIPAFLAVALLASACAAGGPSDLGAGDPGPLREAPRIAGSGADYDRVVTAFPVRDSTGDPYAHPFLGGLNVPRPQLLDIDDDGDQDLFIQEFTGQMSFFERLDSAGVRYAWRSDAWKDLAVGEWYRFADMDGDGDFDLLAEQPFSYIRFYRNVGGPDDPRFRLAADTLKTVSGEPIFSDRQNIPNVADIDCDEKLDLLIGRLTGTITHYEQAAAPTGEDGAPVPRFEKVTDRFEGIEIIGQMQMGGPGPANRPGAGPPPQGDPPPRGGPPPEGGGSGSERPWRDSGPTLHGANTLILADVDEDGDKDILWGDFFEPGLLLIENRGRCEDYDFRSAPQPWPPADPLETSGYNAPAFGDLDGDGDADVLVGVLGGAFNPIRTAAANLYHLENVEGGWEVRTRRFLDQVDVGTESIPAFGDLDGDGDPDLLVANKIEPEDQETSRIDRFENVGSAERPELRRRGALPIRGTFHYAPALADLDGDGDVDLLLGTWRDRVEFYRNEGAVDGAPRFALVDSALVTLTRGRNTTPALADLDRDGDLDLMVGEGSGALNYYRNVGDAGAPRFELVTDEFAGIDVGRRSVPALVDLDDDGDADLVVGSESGELAYWLNESTPERLRFVTARGPELPVQGYSAPAFTDIDADGDLDLFVGTAGGGLLFFRFEGPGGD